MVIKSIRLTNFRIHKNFVLECEPQTTKIVGENGCGKTSILEAVYEVLQLSLIHISEPKRRSYIS